MNSLKDKQFQKLNFWNIISTIALILCAIGITCSHFFNKYFIGKSLWTIVLIEIIGVVLFLLSRVIIFIVKKSMKKDSVWKRLLFYEKAISYFFVANLIFIIVNQEFQLRFPRDIQSGLFFLSLGLYLGFLICKNEYTRSQKKRNSNYLQN